MVMKHMVHSNSKSPNLVTCKLFTKSVWRLC